MRRGGGSGDGGDGGNACVEDASLGRVREGELFAFDDIFTRRKNLHLTAYNYC